MSEIKPSLAATAELSDEQVGLVSSMFGPQQFVDYDKFAQLCFADRLPRIKAELLECNETLAEEIDALQTQDDVRAFANRKDVELTQNAVTAAVQGGRPYRIDRVQALSGSLTLNWSAIGHGFGQLVFYVGEDGKLHADSECMGRHYLRSVLLRMADELVID
ncbi:hypothetical protein F6X40_27865 [Paraburkholderia sp. UCT31]|uniref:hypothetical protein n=1 Tax=Paraburkholderia sp. UCT31 TaxID=2615209 RepID=UPI00165664F3|nr:hypothetical protein [Paraburkholderia sp. UCT31]MBC8740457.1 hypothetical protein [Paraburkholderia sp. UCT31]